MGIKKSFLVFVVLTLLHTASQASTRACLPLFHTSTVHAYVSKHHSYNPFLKYQQEVERIEAMMPDNFRQLAPTDKPHRYDQVVLQLVEIRKQQYAQLLELSQHFRSEHPRHPLNQAFEATLKMVQIFEYDVTGFLHTNNKASDRYELSRKEKTEDGHVQYEFRPYLERKLTHLARSTRGFITELITSLHLPNVVGQGLHIEKLLSSHMIAVLEKNGATKEEIEKFKSFEIDVVFNNGHSWGEVKNYAYTFKENIPFKTHKNNKRLSSPIEKLLFKTELITKMLKILNQNNYNIQMHFFFYNNGVSRSFQQKLKNLGAIVEH